MGKKKRSKNKPPTEQSPEQAQEQGTPPMADEPASPAAPLTQPAPEQQVGDTPAKPWEMPTSEQKAEAKPVRLKTWVSYPERSDKAPVVIVVHEIFGMTDWVRGVADQLAAEGFIAVAPDLLRMNEAPDPAGGTGVVTRPG